ncbi:hypothetical protein Q8W71_13705 [Methylobacterium sp. NEAU 140]|uniref:hypothetical protein n=1 Tax=Methylobacterium sp. NEAU 140 TaxID=3064945 RepID=UPI0027338F63|nr:hypothetical protein [Methylobacterium sp. NEAU 140]MDP4023687.1 hypothetical protein [Methylobacterium sp. NEAU 140]
MGALQQVLVVDDGVRAVDHSLSGELASLGYASVTASLEAADDVLAVIARPAAVLLQACARRDPGYARRAARLRARMRDRGIPVILITDAADRSAGGPVDLATRLNAYVAAQPDL